MAKMFYSIEEAAEKIGVTEQDIKNMAADGKLQQFRDRDKLMFKCDQVDAMAGSGGADPSNDSGVIELLDDSSASDETVIAVSHDVSGPADSDADASGIDLATEQPDAGGQQESPNERTGVSVFDTHEVDTADPMAQTQVTDAFAEEELSLEGIGSGSGLLDLTRESDDTSLGAVLDEVTFSSGEGSDIKFDEHPSGLAANFDSGDYVPDTAGTDIAELGDGDEIAVAGGFGAGGPVAMMPQAHDPVGSAMGAGFLLGTAIALLLALVIAVGSVAGTSTGLLQMMSGEEYTASMWAGGLLVLSVVLGVAGLLVGRMVTR